MRWRLFALALLLLGAAIFSDRSALASVSKSCSDLRAQIANMEKQVPSGAALSVDLAIRKIYVNDCLKHPSDGATPGSAASDPWFNANGDPASGPPPQGDGAYQTTPEIASYCRGSSDPQLCALMLNLGEGEMLAAGGDPQDPADWEKPERVIDPADELPPLRISAGGQTYAIDDACLGGLAGILFSSPGKAGLAKNLAMNIPTPKCASELSAVTSALPALQDAIAQWRAAAQRDPTAPIGANGKALQPGFREMCRQAFNNQNTCQKRQVDMRSVGTDAGLGTIGQAGAFGDCASLYGSVVAMCTQSGWKAPSSTPLRAALRTTEPPPSQPKEDGSGRSAPPPANAAGSAMSAQCQALVQTYVAAAQANDGENALKGYNALKQTCPDVLNTASQQIGVAQPNNSPFPTREGGGMADALMRQCLSADDSCTATANALSGGTSSAARGALLMQSVNFGLALGNLMVQGAALGETLSASHGAATSLPTYRQPDMSSLAAPPIRNGIGQGAPTIRPSPPPHQSDITGLGN